MSTNILDIKGNEIHTSDWVNLSGCRSSKAIVGRDDKGFTLYFGSSNG